MKTLNDIKRAVAKAGATVEEDAGYRDMRVFQLVAPSGKLWAGNDCQCKPVQWATGASTQARQFNESQFADIFDTLLHGLRDMTEEEAADYSEE